MNELRILLQQKLEEIQNLEITAEVPDSMLVEGKTYFSFNLQKSYVSGDMDKQYTYRINLTGFIKRLNNSEENTLEIVDKMSDEVENTLKSLNMKTSFDDVSFTDNIRKVMVQGEVTYNELNKTLV